MRTLSRIAFGAALGIAIAGPARGGDWPMLSGNLARDGFTTECVRPPYRTKWIRWWPGEIMTTRVQAIVADGKVFVGTYGGRLHAVDAVTGEDLWSFQADGPILHCPAADGGLVFFAAASPGRSVFCVRARDGELVWKTECGEGGFCTSPAVARARILIGGRDGFFRALDALSGLEEWSFRTGGPIRTTAAVAGDRVFFASDDMRAYALRLADGERLWVSDTMYGQSLRDYAPVVLGDIVVFRTNPMEQMGVHLGRSYNLVGRTAGIDMSSWKNVDAFVKSDKARGSPEAFEKEQRAILAYLESHPQARTFYALDAATGKEAFRAPVLWGAGCQGVGVPPVRTGDARAIVFTRSAYGNWTLGVAPMVGLQLLDLRADPRPPEDGLGAFPTVRTQPLFHAKGNQPPWNTFWGTADETSTYSCGGTILYVSHQGTLAGFDLETRDLFTIAGKRDTWGGEASLPWARNEWHGPARGAVAIAGDSLYWVTGSRVIAIRGRGADPDERDTARKPAADGAQEPPALLRPPAPEKPLADADAFLRYVREKREVAAAPAGAEALRRRLDRAVSDYLGSPDLAPLLVEIGLGSHDFFFDTSAEVVTALAMADPYLEHGLQVRGRERMRREMGRHPLCGKESRYALDEGERRELYTITDERFFHGWEAPEALPEAYALWLYGDRTGDWRTVERYWERARAAFEALAAKGWRVDIEKGDRFANGFVAGMIGVARLARRFGDEKTAEAASHAAAENLRRLAEHWRKGVAGLPAGQRIENVAAVDRFIGAGNALFFKIVGHRQKIVKFLDLVPEVGRAISDHAPESARVYLDYVDLVLPGWYLAFEERQVHFGENYVDFPDLALGVFEAKAWIGGAGGDALAGWIDIPWCRGDLYDIAKLAIAIECGAEARWKAEEQETSGGG
ncbi:MAG: PQQ-binding-like beta-propeller repeat protein [Planctomycetes bacterium]|nr:PQQ-binding-like beta-propeller repeat protein [Planctomycetota bacterium]